MKLESLMNLVTFFFLSVTKNKTYLLDHQCRHTLDNNLKNRANRADFGGPHEYIL